MNMPKEEQIRTAINDLDENTAKDALALLLSEKEGLQSGGISQPAAASFFPENANFSNFAQIISWLKSKYQFQELDAFSTEADLVYVSAGGRKILLTDITVNEIKNNSVPEAIYTKTLYDGSDADFENAWENIVPDKTNTEKIKQKTGLREVQEGVPDGLGQAFEPAPKNCRFSNLEL